MNRAESNPGKFFRRRTKNNMFHPAAHYFGIENLTMHSVCVIRISVGTSLYPVPEAFPSAAHFWLGTLHFLIFQCFSTGRLSGPEFDAILFVVALEHACIPVANDVMPWPTQTARRTNMGAHEFEEQPGPGLPGGRRLAEHLVSANLVIGKLLAVGKCLDCQPGFVQSICLNCASLLLHMVRPNIWTCRCW